MSVASRCRNRRNGWKVAIPSEPFGNALNAKSEIMHFVKAALAAAFILALTSCSEQYTRRYRITIEVDTPQGLRSGSSVWQVRYGQGNGIPDRSIYWRVRGAAVVVDLTGGTLFAPPLGDVMTDMYARDYPARVIEGHLERHPELGISMGRGWREKQRAIQDARPAFDLDPNEYPLLVTFTDPNDPASITKVNPNYLAGTLGDGVALRRISLAVTDDYPESQIEKWLPWVRSHPAALVRCPHFMPLSQRPLKCRVTGDDFSLGV